MTASRVRCRRWGGSRVVPGGILDRDVQQRQQRRQERLQRAIQHQELARSRFSRIARGSSRSWIRQYAFSRSMTGR